MPDTDDELYAAAKAHYIEYRVAVALVQEYVFPGEWEADPYGDGGGVCEGADVYDFDLRRDIGNGDGWRLEQSPKDHAVSLAQWLEANGWEQVDAQVFDTGTSSVGAGLPGVIERLVVQFHPGKVADGISLTAQTECFPGDKYKLFNLESGWDYGLSEPNFYHPEFEAHDAVPAFGVTRENEPNFLEDEWAAAWGKASKIPSREYGEEPSVD